MQTAVRHHGWKWVLQRSVNDGVSAFHRQSIKFHRGRWQIGQLTTTSVASAIDMSAQFVCVSETETD